MRSFLASVLALVLALGVFAGCGGDDNGDGDSGTDLALNSTTTADVGDGDPAATETPQGAAALDEFQELARAEGQPSVPAIRGSAGLTLPEWIHTVNGDVGAYWQKQFNDAGFQYSPAQEVIFTGKTQTACGFKASVNTGPLYCTADQAMYLPVDWFEQTAEPFGDAADAVVIAHENGHRVQDLLGLFNSPLLSAQLELQADCLAGVWAKSIYDRGLLEEGDIGEILGLVNISGDSEDVAINAPGAHGNSALRQEFFAQGYNGGSPGDCPPPKKRDLAGQVNFSDQS